MQVEDVHFKTHKDNALKKLEVALRENKVDSLVRSLLNNVNSQKDYFTTSSCAGRIVILQLPEIGDKKKAVFLGCWHQQITVEDVFNALASFEKGQAWLLTQPPIFHIGCKHLKAAGEILNLGVTSGFKHSGIRSVSGQIIVELRSTERMDMPLGKQGTMFIDKETIFFLVDIANTALFRAQEKLTRLKEMMTKINQNSF